MSRRHRIEHCQVQKQDDAQRNEKPIINPYVERTCKNQWVLSFLNQTYMKLNVGSQMHKRLKFHTIPLAKAEENKIAQRNITLLNKLDIYSKYILWGASFAIFTRFSCDSKYNS